MFFTWPYTRTILVRYEFNKRVHFLMCYSIPADQSLLDGEYAMALPKIIHRGGNACRVFANRYRVEKQLSGESNATVYLVEDMRTKGKW